MHQPRPADLSASFARVPLVSDLTPELAESGSLSDGPYFHHLQSPTEAPLKF
jgi:hypothetical protein